MKTTTLQSKYSISRAPYQLPLLLIPLALLCFTLSPQARASCQEGCFANENTVLGDDALLQDTGVSNNVAIGSEALSILTSGSVNAAVGSAAMQNNTSGSVNTAIGGGAALAIDNAAKRVAPNVSRPENFVGMGVRVDVSTTVDQFLTKAKLFRETRNLLTSFVTGMRPPLTVKIGAAAGPIDKTRKRSPP